MSKKPEKTIEELLEDFEVAVCLDEDRHGCAAKCADIAEAREAIIAHVNESRLYKGIVQGAPSLEEIAAKAEGYINLESVEGLRTALAIVAGNIRSHIEASNGKGRK